MTVTSILRSPARTTIDLDTRIQQLAAYGESSAPIDEELALLKVEIDLALADGRFHDNLDDLFEDEQMQWNLDDELSTYF